jgi:methylenetetrahydrofolate reductase (NADPH)
VTGAWDTATPAPTRVSVELVPRSPTSVQAEVATIREHLPHVDTVNVPDLLKFPLRSWDACALARRVSPAPGRAPYRAIPHLRAQDLDPEAALPMARTLDDAEISEVLVVTGDAPADLSVRTYDVTTVEAIARLRRELPDLTIYAGLDPYRQAMIAELDYARRKLDAGAAGFFTQPFFDTALMQTWSALVSPDILMWWGVTTVTTPGSYAYWRRRNQVVFPSAFEPTLAWHRDLAQQAVDFARVHGDHVYLMPVRVDVQAYLEGIV